MRSSEPVPDAPDCTAAHTDRPIALLHAARVPPNPVRCESPSLPARALAMTRALAMARAPALACTFAPALSRPEARHVPVRAQVTLALAPVLALALKLARVGSPPRSRELPRVLPLPLRELPQAPRELRAPHATTARCGRRRRRRIDCHHRGCWYRCASRRCWRACRCWRRRSSRRRLSAICRRR